MQTHILSVYCDRGSLHSQAGIARRIRVKVHSIAYSRGKRIFFAEKTVASAERPAKKRVIAALRQSSW